MTPHDYKLLAFIFADLILFSVIPWTKQQRKGWPSFSAEREHRRRNGVGNGLLDGESGMSTVDIVLWIIGIFWTVFTVSLFWIAYHSPHYKL